MAIARGTGTQTATANSGTTLVITKPTGTVDGDVLWAFLIDQGTLGTWSPPAGWTSAGATNCFSSAGRAEAFYKVASGEGASYTFTFSQTITAASGGMDRYTGVNNVTPIDVAASTNIDDTGTNAAPVGLSITTVTDGAMLIMGIAANSATAVITAALTESWQVTTVKRSESADAIQASHGASGNKTGSLSAAKAWATILGALRPAGGTTYSKSNTGTSPATASGADQFLTVDAGTGASTSTGSGADQFLTTDRGTGTSTATASGADQFIDVDAGSGTSTATGSGADQFVDTDSGTGTATSTASGVSAPVFSELATGTSTATASGADQFVDTDTGAGTSAATASGASQLIHPGNVSGAGDTSWVPTWQALAGEAGPRVTHGLPGQLPTRERARREKVAAELAELEMRAEQNADEDALVEMLMLI